MKVFLTIIVCLFLFNCKTIAQNKTEIITQCKQFKYCYKDGFYTKKSLRKIIVTNDDAYRSYNKFEKIRNISIASILVTLGVVGLGLESPCTEYDETCIYSRVFIGGSAALMVLPTFFISRVKFWKSIRLFNEAQSPSIGITPMELNLKYTGNGIGLVLTF